MNRRSPNYLKQEYEKLKSKPESTCKMHIPSCSKTITLTNVRLFCLLPFLLFGQIFVCGGQTTFSETLRKENINPSVVSITSTLNSDGHNIEEAATTKLTNSLQIENINQIHHPQKLKPVNLTLVDETYESCLNQSELLRKWKHMDNQLQDGVKGILKMIFPQIVALSQDAKVSGDCSGSILKWILSLRNLKSWAIKMLDATGKPSAGIFEGSLSLFGNYRQCLNIRVPDEDEMEMTDQFEEYFRGQFCEIHLKPWMPKKKPYYLINSSIDSLLRKDYKFYEKTLYDELAEIAVAFNFLDIRLDFCLPSTCSIGDVQRVADLISKKVELRAKVVRCDVAPTSSSFLSDIDSTTAFWLIIPISLITVSLLATLIALCQSDSIVEVNRTVIIDSDKLGTSRPITMLQKFLTICETLSILNSIKSRLRTPGNNAVGNQGELGEYEDDASSNVNKVKPLPLYGLRFIIVIWFMIIQMTVELNYQYLRESLSLRQMMISYWPFQIIINSILVFDSMLLLSAFTLGYSCIESNIADLFRYILSKYVRLLPSILFMVSIVCLTPVFGFASPVWKTFLESQANTCKSNGLINFTFLQNFLPYNKIVSS